jgi:hypothetical protein
MGEREDSPAASAARTGPHHRRSVPYRRPRKAISSTIGATTTAQNTAAPTAVRRGAVMRKLRDYLSDPVRPLPHYRVGGKVLVRRSEFDSWIAAFMRRVAQE